MRLAEKHGRARARAARLDRRGDGVPRRPQGLGQRRGDAASSDAGRARVLRAPRHLRADEPAGARRAPSPGHLGGGSPTASSTCSAPTTPRTRARKRTTPIPTRHSGMTGVQTLVPIMLDHVNAGRLTLERFVDLTSARPAAAVRHPRQGPHRRRLRRRFHHRRPEAPRDDHQRAGSQSRCGWTPYDGVSVQGWPVGTIVRGRRVMWDGEHRRAGARPARALCVSVDRIRGRPLPSSPCQA